MRSLVKSVVLGFVGLLGCAAADMAAAQATAGLNESEVRRLLSGRTIQFRRGPATFGRDGAYRFEPQGSNPVVSTWRPCGSAVCLASGWKGTLAKDGGNNVVLTDPQGNRIAMGVLQ
jgi:hypothetical protein